MKHRILVVEDEPKILQGILDALTLQGFDVSSATRGDEALTQALTEKPDLLILDIMLPKLSGLDVCENLRRSGVHAPIIILSARGSEKDRVKGLELGADDYIAKPFSIKELVARVQAHLRRRNMDAVDTIKPGRQGSVYRIKDTLLDFDARTCWVRGQSIHLSEKEFQIIQILLEHVGSVVDRETLLREVWGYRNLDLETRTVDVTIGKLRQKIEVDPSNPEIIKTKRGRGYIIEGPI